MDISVLLLYLEKKIVILMKNIILIKITVTWIYFCSLASILNL